MYKDVLFFKLTHICFPSMFFLPRFSFHYEYKDYDLPFWATYDMYVPHYPKLTINIK